MAGTDPALIVRVGANLDDLKAGLTTADGAVKSFATTVTDTLGNKMPAGLEHLADATHTATDSMGMLEGVVTGFVGGLSVTAVLSFAESLVSLGDRLQTLHDRTELSTDELQRLDLIAKTSGTSLETFAKAAFFLSRQLAEGKQSTIEALKDLGFTLEQLKAMTPDRRIEELGKALANLDDPLRRDKDGVALLGRSFDELIPALKNLNEETNTHIKLSPEEISMLSGVSSGFVRLKESIAPVIVQWIDGALHASEFYNILQDIGVVAIELPKVSGEAADGVKKWTDANKAWVASLQDRISAARVNAALMVDLAADEKERAAAAKEAHQRELEEAEATMKMWEAYFKAYDDMRALSAENAKKTTVQMSADLAKRKDAINAEIVATAELNVAYGATATGGIRTVTTAYETYIAKLEELHKHKVEDVSQTNQEALITKEYTDALYNEAVAQDTATASKTAAVPPTDTLNASMKQTAGTIRLNIDTLEEYNRAIHDFYDQFVGAAGGVGTPGVGSYGTTAGPAGWNMPRMLGMQGGGAVTSGQPYMVGERGPEVFVPGASGTVVPNSGGMVTNIYITQPLGTPQAIAAAVGAAQLGALQNRGERFRPSGV